VSKSAYVCKRCGCAVYSWGGKGTWKHATGGNSRSCRQKPVVMERQAYDEWMEQEVAGMRAAMKRFLGR
jgi:hypothetical protein